MDNFIIDMAARAAGLSEPEIAKLEADAPGIAALVHTLRQGAPLIQQAQALYAQASALYEKAKPMISQALAELPTLDADAQIIVRVLAGARPGA